MGRVAYSIADAAAATATSEAIINEAIRAGHLVARVAGSSVVIAHPALKRWVKTLPQFS